MELKSVQTRIQRFLGHMVAVVGCSADGTGDDFGLVAVDAPSRQLSGNLKRVEHALQRNTTIPWFSTLAPGDIAAVKTDERPMRIRRSESTASRRVCWNDPAAGTTGARRVTPVPWPLVAMPQRRGLAGRPARAGMDRRPAKGRQSPAAAGNAAASRRRRCDVTHPAPCFPEP